MNPAIKGELGLRKKKDLIVPLGKEMEEIYIL